jgi:hypothetical protein
LRPKVAARDIWTEVDHLGGATHAIDLVKHLRDQYSNDPLGQFASDLLVEIEADKAVLQGWRDRLEVVQQE